MRTTIILVLVLICPYATHAKAADAQGPQRHYKESSFKVTDKGLFGVELVVKGDKLKVGSNSIDIIIHDKDDKDVTGAELSVTPRMSSMGHGVLEKPVIMERGGGVYSVDNVDLPTGGNWELKIRIKKHAMEDNTIFDFPDVKGNAVHAISGRPSNLDLSSTRLSAHKIFKVSFTSKLAPVVINRMHSWELTVETADGMPVTGALITVGGGMPQHGHGLPTEPAVTEELGNGRYLVGGMKFSMPGWWVVKFHIRAKDKEDTVTFNLLLR